MIKLLCIDVDGTLNDGKLHLNNTGEYFKDFHVRDGLALRYWTKELKRDACIISGRNASILNNRFKDLGVERLYYDVKNKGEKLLEIKGNLQKSEIAVIGDDLNDLSIFKQCELSFAVADAHVELKKQASIILCAKGGRGALREMIEIILKMEQKYEEFILHWK